MVAGNGNSMGIGIGISLILPNTPYVRNALNQSKAIAITCYFMKLIRRNKLDLWMAVENWDWV